MYVCVNIYSSQSSGRVGPDYLVYDYQKQKSLHYLCQGLARVRQVRHPNTKFQDVLTLRSMQMRGWHLKLCTLGTSHASLTCQS